MWNFDAFGGESDRSHKNVPFYLSDRGYGVLSTAGCRCSSTSAPAPTAACRSSSRTTCSTTTCSPDPTPAQVLDRLDALTGRPYLPPRWAFGAWISSGFFPDSQQRVLDRARRIREDDIPCDVLHLDCYWQVAGHWSDLRWDADAFPDPDGMLKRPHRAGLPGVPVDEPVPDDRQPALRRGRGRRLLPAPPGRKHVRRRHLARQLPGLRHRGPHQPGRGELVPGPAAPAARPGRRGVQDRLRRGRAGRRGGRTTA